MLSATGMPKDGQAEGKNGLPDRTYSLQSVIGNRPIPTAGMSGVVAEPHIPTIQWRTSANSQLPSTLFRLKCEYRIVLSLKSSVESC